VRPLVVLVPQSSIRCLLVEFKILFCSPCRVHNWQNNTFLTVALFIDVLDPIRT
jgi:hypothetical protein